MTFLPKNEKKKSERRERVHYVQNRKRSKTILLLPQCWRKNRKSVVILFLSENPVFYFICILDCISVANRLSEVALPRGTFIKKISTWVRWQSMDLPKYDPKILTKSRPPKIMTPPKKCRQNRYPPPKIMKNTPKQIVNFGVFRKAPLRKFFWKRFTAYNHREGYSKNYAPDGRPLVSKSVLLSDIISADWQ